MTFCKLLETTDSKIYENFKKFWLVKTICLVSYKKVYAVFAIWRRIFLKI